MNTPGSAEVFRAVTEGSRFRLADPIVVEAESYKTGDDKYKASVAPLDESDTSNWKTLDEIDPIK